MANDVLSASFIPSGGGGLAVLIASIVVAMICATVAIERRTNIFLWAVGGFVVTFVLAAGAHALLS